MGNDEIFGGGQSCGVVNHENLVTTLGNAISDIAERLPQLGLRLTIFPTERMKGAITNVFICILTFFARAKSWYDESKLSRLRHSFTAPVELRYKDVLAQIASRSRDVEQLAMSGQLAEVRTMHEKIDNIDVAIRQITTAVTLHSNALINTNDRISDLQFFQISTSLDDAQTWHAERLYRYHQAMRRQYNQRAGARSISTTVKRSTKWRQWSATTTSKLSIVTGNYYSRFDMRALCVDIIEQLRKADIPVLLAMRMPLEAMRTSKNLDSIGVLKYLVRQALQIRCKSETEKTMALRCASFHSASTENDWLDLLSSVLFDLGGQIYIVVDLSMLERDPSIMDGFSWAHAFERIFASLLTRGSIVMIKVLMVCYGPIPFELSPSERIAYVIPVKTEIITARQRRSGRGMSTSKLLPPVASLRR